MSYEKEREALKGLADEARRLSALNPISVTDARRLETVMKNAKALHSRISGLEAIDDFTNSSGLGASSGPAFDDEGFKAGSEFRPSAKSIVEVITKGRRGAKAPGDPIIAGGSFEVPAQRDETEFLPFKPSYVTDLIGTRVLQGNQFTYLRQNARVHRAAPVADGQQKPRDEMQLTEMSGNTETIATLSPEVPNRLFRSSAELGGWVQRELVDSVNAADESQLVDTVLADPDIQTALFDTDFIRTFRMAALALEKEFFTPNVLLVSLEVQAEIDLLKSSDGPDGFYYVYGLPQRGAGAGSPMVGLRVVSNDSIPNSTALMLDTNAVRRYIDGSVRIDVNPYSAFELNLVTVRAEHMSGVAIRQPRAIVAVATGISGS